MNKSILGVLLPCYNEEENIERLIEEWINEEKKLKEIGVSLKIIVVDDGSQDNTRNIVNKNQKIYNNIIAINHRENKGLGQAMNTGIDYVVNNIEYDLLCVMDGDCTHEPKYIYSMINQVDVGYECVIASRYEKGSSVEGLSFFRQAVSYGARWVYSLALRIPKVKDYTCGYRLYKMETLRSLSKKYKGRIVEESSFACMMELLYKLHKNGCKITEVPFILKYQLKGGESKMRVVSTMRRSLRTTGKLLFAWKG